MLALIAALTVTALTADGPQRTARAAVATIVAVAWAALAALFPGNPPGERVWLFLALSGLLVAGIWWLGNPAADRPTTAAVVVAGTLATPVVFVVTVYGTIVLGPLLTGLAGNEALNGDEDMIPAVGSLLSGLLVARSVLAVRRPGHRVPAQPVAS